MASALAQLLLLGILVFLVLGSGVLFWDGLALGFGHGHATGRALRLARARMVVGLLGVAFAVWLAAAWFARVR